MAVHVEMRGRLEKLELQGDVERMLGKFNVAAAERMQFVLLEKTDGHPVGVYIPNILTFEEVDDDDYLA